jgi:transcriptional regulator with XRE-family HTH domain
MGVSYTKKKSCQQKNVDESIAICDIDDMQLAQYIKSGKGTQASIAKQLRVTRARVWNWASGRSRPRPKYALALEKATGGEVSAEEAIGLGNRRT